MTEACTLASIPGPQQKKGVLSGRTVLVAEDNPDTADSLRELIDLFGHRVEVAHSGTEAIARAHAFRPEVVLCDIGLPGMDGYRVAQRALT